MTLIYGHRGARGEAPENTLAGFQHCLKQGVTHCELDLHLSRDDELVVIHDPTLRRTTGRHGKVIEQTARQLVGYDARRNGPGWPVPTPIPRLAELFEHCPFEHWQLEVKSASKIRAARTVKAIERLVNEFDIAGNITVTSGSHVVLKALQALTPSLARGLVAEHGWLDPVKIARRYGCTLLALNWKLCTPGRLQKARQNGLHVSLWTVNDPLLIQHFAAHAVDSIITDFPSRAVTALSALADQ